MMLLRFALLIGPAVCWANESVFTEKLQPLLARHCAFCHTGRTAQSGFSVTSLADLVKGGKRGPGIIPGNANASKLLQFVRGDAAPRMPLGSPPLPESVISELAAAIDAMTPAPAAVSTDHAKWLFSKPARIAPPSKTGNPIDAFIQARLKEKGLKPAPPADKRALLRRVYFDLIGLPPSLEETAAFLNDPSANAYDTLVDKLLSDKRYGERWARHWLDLVRFAESDGFAIDGERPTAWRYRDYVIRAFNDDKAYDDFIQEQLAGDEMGGRGGGQNLIATGYLRMGPWEADANFDNQLRLDWLNEMAGTTSQVFLGLTAGCARCHDHKYDPIPQKDFYRLQAFFAATRTDERPAPFSDAEGRLHMRSMVRKYEDDLEGLDAAFKSMESALKAKLKPKEKLPEVIADAKNVSLTEAERKDYKALQERITRMQGEMRRYQPLAYAVNEVAPPQILEVAPTYVLGGGELASKGERVEPGFLRAVTGSGEDAKLGMANRYRSGRRKVLAEWIASAGNPLTARVMVNRIWQHHFGQGIVRTPSDFGMNGDRPSHPELLDWLANEFVDKKWSIKAMHRLMLTSDTYKQSTRHADWKAYTETDSDNRLLWRANWSRLEAEVLRDSLLSLSGRLNSEAGGPGMFFNVSDEVAKGFQMFKWYPSEEKQQLRRSIYAFQRRSLAMPMLEVFDAANMSESCSRRGSTTVAPQALTLLNGALTATESEHFAARVIELAGPSMEKQVDRAFDLVLARPPKPAELSEARKLYEGRAPKEALTRLATVLFNLNEFLYLE
ncbi:MAG: DUF1553 domain-containing protein [Acidobacteria bacterium]|nr:DUF1553 domain-containing protein [Acidobacteriota bacterium]